MMHAYPSDLYFPIPIHLTWFSMALFYFQIRYPFSACPEDTEIPTMAYWCAKSSPYPLIYVKGKWIIAMCWPNWNKIHSQSTLNERLRKITNDSRFWTSRHDSDNDTQFSVILWMSYTPQRSHPWGHTYNSVRDNFLRISPDLCATARAPDPWKKPPLRQQSSKLFQASVQCLEHSKILEERLWKQFKQFSSLVMECKQNINEVLFLLSRYM